MENLLVRPQFAPAVFRDSAGSVGEYGAQWRQYDVPQDAYSRVSHPERFAGIQQGGVANPGVKTVRVQEARPRFEMLPHSW
ncbi:DUF6226 family protein [Arthrobacter alpinus]|uniref:DUF6226 family protein n=1 Tax=Arthrobacter alpinus TaxID=656366 RepID=UPI001647403E|nr:DUF6226 family protein [Arthrobacter alpinus]